MTAQRNLCLKGVSFQPYKFPRPRDYTRKNGLIGAALQTHTVVLGRRIGMPQRRDIIYRAVTWLITCNIISKSIPVPTVLIIRITLAPVPQTAMIARGSATMDFIAMAMNV